MHKIVIALGILISSGATVAGSATGKVATIFVADNSSAVLFTLSSQIENTPRCNEEQRFSLDLSKPGGMAAYMALLEAKRESYEVRVAGLNTCANEWKSEDIKSLILY